MSGKVSGTMVGHDDIRPEAAPPSHAAILYQETKVPVTVRAHSRGDRFTIGSYAHGELFDSEQYLATPEVFALVQGAGESFVPPIPILKFPLNLGGPGWDWSGTLSSEDDPHPASAKVNATPDMLTIGPATFDSVHVSVELTISPYRGAKAARRSMDFWFEARHGLIKRDFARTSVRQPVFP